MNGHTASGLCQAFGVNNQQDSVRELIGQIENWMVRSMGVVFLSKMYKLESVVVVDPQITMTAAETKEEVGQANTGAS